MAAPGRVRPGLVDRIPRVRSHCQVRDVGCARRPEGERLSHAGQILTSDLSINEFAHLVNGSVLAEDVLIADAVGPHIARALGQIVTRYAAAAVPTINAAVDALAASGGSGF
jgi:hypothetical protein